jgi:uncharacterized protein (TIGR02145 family)
MKKLITLILGIAIVYSCSTSSDNSSNDTSVPVTPTNLTGGAISSTQIELKWLDNSTNESGYKIERRAEAGNYSVVGTVNSNNSSFIENNLNPNNSYYYRVYSYNSAGNSPTYSNEIKILILPCITIGSQVWTTNNLQVDSYSDGTPIPQVTDPTQWSNSIQGAWCYYQNNTAYGTTYGKLYNWYAVNGRYTTGTSSRKKIAPDGWHVPSKEEWVVLSSYLGGDNFSGGKLKETGITHWKSPNEGATNSTGFSGLPGGFRASGTSNNITYNSYYWSSLEYNSGYSYYFKINYNDIITTIADFSKSTGMSVRLIRD